MAGKRTPAQRAAIARKRPGTTPKPGQKVTIGPQRKGQKPVTFTKGGLHKSLGVPQDEKIPESKMRAALAGRYGPLAKKQAVMAQGMLKAGQKTAAKRR